MNLPQLWDDEIGKFTGKVKFRKEVYLQSGQTGSATLSLGRIDENDQVYINGFFVGQTQNQQWWRNRNYVIGDGILNDGINTIAIEVENLFGAGGINGNKDQMFLKVKNKQYPVSGVWKYQIGEKYAGDKKPAIDLISHFLKFNKKSEGQFSIKQAQSSLINIQTIENQMKFNKSLIEVPAGSEITLRFENTDHMAHNLLILEKGALREVGILADKLALESAAENNDYIPKSDKILAHTSLVYPGQSAEIRFSVPREKGDYPFVCTFPGHWQIMNGILRVN
jgi:azurin